MLECSSMYVTESAGMYATDAPSDMGRGRTCERRHLNGDKSSFSSMLSFAGTSFPTCSMTIALAMTSSSAPHPWSWILQVSHAIVPWAIISFTIVSRLSVSTARSGCAQSITSQVSRLHFLSTRIKPTCIYRATRRPLPSST